jgi:protein gp37
MAQSSIEWTEMTWNPVTGCDKISAGCKYCYAEAFSRRLKAMGVDKYANGFNLTLHPMALDEPYKWKKPRIVFVNSMSDLFHEDVPVDYIQRTFQVMKDNPQHVFQVLTKRSDIVLYYDKEGWIQWPHNVWMGVSVENEEVLHRVDHLRKTNARVKFLSCEPLLGSLSGLELKGIDWVIVGGESGRKARQMNPRWVHEIRDNCQRNDVPFFFKQWGGINKKKAGRMLDGRTWDSMPPAMSV